MLPLPLLATPLVPPGAAPPPALLAPVADFRAVLAQLVLTGSPRLPVLAEGATPATEAASVAGPPEANDGNDEAASGDTAEPPAAAPPPLDGPVTQDALEAPPALPQTDGPAMPDPTPAAPAVAAEVPAAKPAAPAMDRADTKVTLVEPSPPTPAVPLPTAVIPAPPGTHPPTPPAPTAPAGRAEVAAPAPAPADWTGTDLAPQSGHERPRPQPVEWVPVPRTASAEQPLPATPLAAKPVPVATGNGAVVTAVLARLHGTPEPAPAPVPPRAVVAAPAPLAASPAPLAKQALPVEAPLGRDPAARIVPPVVPPAPLPSHGTMLFAAPDAARQGHVAPLPDINVQGLSDQEKPILVNALPERLPERLTDLPPTEIRRQDAPRLEGADLARQAPAVARQVAEAVQPAEAGGFDLALDPEELGLLRLKLTSGEGGSILMIQAERPETLDLIRRHVALLEQDLRALGHDNLTLQFSGGGGHGTGGFGRPDGGPPPAEAPPEAATSAPKPKAAGVRLDHLDLRL